MNIKKHTSKRKNTWSVEDYISTENIFMEIISYKNDALNIGFFNPFEGGGSFLDQLI